ncbi:hypothetical protein KGF57_005136 [Candida theae]|uniref:Uncharacterized protein n=1 Tax=Candida theae TaxID=1198502 RepID=A0AAD5FWI3_9ASCO|nr:uncharacterized protein KGF57_005136 [Candida theae]KAI5948943.1 hypothetical protein KGF57_005136 [Candida theae]
MGLLSHTTPKLPHQSQDSNYKASSPAPSQTNRNEHLTLHRRHKATPEKSKVWFKRKILSSDADETDDTEYGESVEDNGSASDSIEKTPSPRKPIQLPGQKFFEFASTPINPDSTVSFLSPMRMLNDLHLKSQVFDTESDASDDIHTDAEGNMVETIQEQSDNEVGLDDDGNSVGNKTMINNSDESDDEFPISPPKFINRKKRMHSDAIESKIVTPLTSQDSHMSICNTTAHTANSSTLKLSFSTNDSTPCPPQPKRKKLKFKHASTETILDLNYARKTSLQELAHRPQGPLQSLDDHDDDDDDHDDEEKEEEEEAEEAEDDYKNNSNSFDNHNGLESTPISQSTPTSSRASTPPLPPPPSSTATTQEYGPSVNGYKFVRQRPSSFQFKYETPINGNRYAQMRHSYCKQNYSVVGELPVTSAGMMDEDGVHVGDRRINDPYLTSQYTETASVNDRIRLDYHNNLKLPLPPPYFDQDNLSTDQIKHLITQDSLKQFYDMIVQGSMLDLLRQERIKWHPDKWVGKLRQYPHTNISLPIIDRLSQTINALIDNYN